MSADSYEWIKPEQRNSQDASWEQSKKQAVTVFKGESALTEWYVGCWFFWLLCFYFLDCPFCFVFVLCCLLNVVLVDCWFCIRIPLISHVDKMKGCFLLIHDKCTEDTCAHVCKHKQNNSNQQNHHQNANKKSKQQTNNTTTLTICL